MNKEKRVVFGLYRRWILVNSIRTVVSELSWRIIGDIETIASYSCRISMYNRTGIDLVLQQAIHSHCPFFTSIPQNTFFTFDC
jgi:hypothetical protein